MCDNPIHCLRHGGLGDLLMCMPAVRQLWWQRRCPIVFWMQAKYSDLICTNPYVSEVRNSDITTLCRLEIDRGDVDFSGVTNGLRDAGLTVPAKQAFCDAAGVPRDSEPYLFVDMESAQWAHEKVAELREGYEWVVGMQRTTSTYQRDWYDDRWLELFHLLPEVRFVMLMHAKGHSMPLPPNVTCLENMLMLPQVAAVVERCDLVVSPDSALYHIAGAVGTPAVVMFGMVDPKLRLDGYANCWPVSSEGCKDAPCYSTIGQCFQLPTPCMRELSARRVACEMDVALFSSRIEGPRVRLSDLRFHPIPVSGYAEEQPDQVQFGFRAMNGFNPLRDGKLENQLVGAKHVVVTNWLEHVADPKPELMRMRMGLADGGMVTAVVGLGHPAKWPLFGNAWTEELLTELFGQCGFHDVETKRDGDTIMARAAR